MQQQERWTLNVNSDLQVVRYDPEYADMDHPNGEIVRDVFFLIATDEIGNRRRFGSFLTLEAAEASIPDAPEVFTWDETYPEYGSVAYELYGNDADLEAEHRMEDAAEMGFDTRYMRF